MDVNLKKGEVQSIYSDFMNKVAKETTIQLTDTEAIKFVLDLENKCINMTYMNTLFDEPEKSSVISKDDFTKLIKGGKDLLSQIK